MIKYLSPKDLADMVGYHPFSIARLCREGVIPATKFAGKWLIHEKDVKKFIEENKNDSETTEKSK